MAFRTIDNGWREFGVATSMLSLVLVLASDSRAQTQKIRISLSSRSNTKMDRLAEKRRPLDEVRDFSFARLALKDLESSKR